MDCPIGIYDLFMVLFFMVVLIVRHQGYELCYVVFYSKNSVL